MKKVGKTTRPFRYDLNKIPYDYTVEVRNRFKGLDLIDRMPDELRMKVRDIVQETGIKTIPKKKKCKKAKWLSGEALQIAMKRREVGMDCHLTERRSPRYGTVALGLQSAYGGPGNFLSKQNPRAHRQGPRNLQNENTSQEILTQKV